MDLYLQFGHGMMGYCRELIGNWQEGTVILSPRDLTEEQARKFSKEIISINGQTLFDPQYYNPRADHHRLTGWPHWFNNFDTMQLSDKAYIEDRLVTIKNINNHCLTSSYIVPSILCEAVDRHWVGIQNLFIDASSKIFTDKERYATLALSFDVIVNEKTSNRL